VPGVSTRRGDRGGQERCRKTAERSLALATVLAPSIGYDQAAEVAKEAHRSGRTVREVAQAWEVLSAAELDAAFDVRRMTEPGLDND
jgi:fumarate hydratase class II